MTIGQACKQILDRALLVDGKTIGKGIVCEGKIVSPSQWLTEVVIQPNSTFGINAPEFDNRLFVGSVGDWHHTIFRSPSSDRWFVASVDPSNNFKFAAVKDFSPSDTVQQIFTKTDVKYSFRAPFTEVALILNAALDVLIGYVKQVHPQAVRFKGLGISHQKLYARVANNPTFVSLFADLGYDIQIVGNDIVISKEK